MTSRKGRDGRTYIVPSVLKRTEMRANVCDSPSIIVRLHDRCRASENKESTKHDVETNKFSKHDA